MTACVYVGEALGRYHFGASHPFGPGRMEAFWAEAERRGLAQRVQRLPPVLAPKDTLEMFHTPAYVERVRHQCAQAWGYLDQGDTPALPGLFEAAATVVGCSEDALGRIMRGDCRRAMVPIGGLHHARHDAAAGFCVFNDCATAIRLLQRRYGLQRIAYVDIDAHHGDGVYYSFESDRAVFIADIHEDGHYLYPGTGEASERGQGAAEYTKLNIPLAPDSGDEDFKSAWRQVELFLGDAEPEFFLLQCGADGLAGDPLTHLRYSPQVHAFAARRLCAMADDLCGGRLLAWGGGGYRLDNLATAWSLVLEALAEGPSTSP